jgi:hypothetical protein
MQSDEQKEEMNVVDIQKCSDISYQLMTHLTKQDYLPRYGATCCRMFIVDSM